MTNPLPPHRSRYHSWRSLILTVLVVHLLSSLGLLMFARSTGRVRPGRMTCRGRSRRAMS